MKNNNKFCGIDINEIFMQIPRNTIRDVKNGDNKMLKIFNNDNEGKLDFAIYILLLDSCNTRYKFDTTVSKLARLLGYKPRTGKGNINERIMESLKRLDSEYLLIDLSCCTKNDISGTVILSEVDTHFFKLYNSKITKIYKGSKLIDSDYVNKYNVPNAVYVYCYLLSMMGEHSTTVSSTYKTYIAFPSMDKITKYCNIDKLTLRKLLIQFEYDELIYTVNLGTVNGGSLDKLTEISLQHTSANYYTTDLAYLPSAYMYAEGFYDLHKYTYKKSYQRKAELLEEIQQMRDLAVEKLNSKELIKFKEINKSMVEKLILEVNTNDKIMPTLKPDEYKEYCNKRLYKKSKHKQRNNNYSEDILYIASMERFSIELLNHVKNKTKYLMMLFELD